MRVIYTIAVYLYSFSIGIASLFNTKAKLWFNGRKNIIAQIKNDFATVSEKTIWIHSASLGEFEQGRPLIEELKAKYPNTKIVLTFFSPSGYEIRKDYPLADYIYYLPIDTPQNAKAFIKIINPSIAIFIKYEFWYNYMNELDQQKIPLIYISAIFRPNQLFFKPCGKWFLNHLRKANHFFVQNEISKNLLKAKAIHQVSVSGDTRFDRVASILKQAKENEIVKIFKGSSSLLLAGSSWPKDEEIIKELSKQHPEIKIIIAPHLIDKSHISQIKSIFPEAITYSKAIESKISKAPILIIDNMGMLSSLYQYADFALIGGGFGAGIHNTLEAATYGMPIFIGPNYHKFQEAKDLIEIGVITVFNDAIELKEKFEIVLHDKEKYNHIVNASKEYVQSNSGATNLIMKKVVESLEI
ncbi:MAG: 3-deoxy-D-manno-octulosonic acid transferase [Bacteroidales bacterium]|nr:3-deoxy-D-manno-octulosonic acid transferase [Bacteroidales bacterium]